MGEKRKQRLDLHRFRSISHAISTYEDLNLLIRHIVEGIGRAFEARGCCILLFDDREQQLFVVGCYGISDRYLNKGPILVDDRHSVITVGEPVYIENMQKDPRVQYPEAAAEENFASMMSIPIKCRDAVTGMLRMYHSEPLLLHASDIRSLCVLTEQLGVVIENSGLRNFLDGLKLVMDNLPLRMIKGLYG